MSLSNELKMNRSFSSLGEEAFLSLWRSFSLLEPFIAVELAPHELTMAQFNILRILKGSQFEDGMSCSEIGERMVSRDSDLTRLLDKLEKRGFVQRTRPQHDRRKVHSTITLSGREILEELSPRVAQAAKSCFDHLTEEQLAKLIHLLEIVRDAHIKPQHQPIIQV